MKETDKLIASTLNKKRNPEVGQQTKATHTQFTSCTKTLVLELAFLWP